MQMELLIYAEIPKLPSFLPDAILLSLVSFHTIVLNSVIALSWTKPKTMKRFL